MTHNGAYPNGLRQILGFREKGDRVTSRISSRTDEYLVVTVTHETPEWTTTMDFEFWTKPRLPVVLRISGESKSSRRTLFTSTDYEDFVEVSGGFVARTMRGYHKIHLDRPRYKVQIWRSEDLGKRQPTAADFQVRVPEGTKIAFLNPESIPKPVNGVRVLDPAKLTLSDIDHSLRDVHGNRIGVRPQASAPQSRSFWLLRLVGIAALATVLGWCGYRWYQRGFA